MKSSYQFLAKEKMSTGKLDMSDCKQYNSVCKASSFRNEEIFTIYPKHATLLVLQM